MKYFTWYPSKNETLTQSKFIYLFIYFIIETYLYRVDIISSQAIFHMCPVTILLRWWPIVSNARPTLKQTWVNVSCLQE